VDAAARILMVPEVDPVRLTPDACTVLVVANVPALLTVS
jgi:hypothetical protein